MLLDAKSALAVLEQMRPARTYGKVSKVVGLVAEGRGIKAPIGSVCELLSDDGRGATTEVPAEVVGFRDGACLFMECLIKARVGSRHGFCADCTSVIAA